MDFFTNDTVANAVKSGGLFTEGRVTFCLPRFFSFCGGVVRAVKMVVELCENHGGNGRIVLLGDVVHNPDINEWFLKNGAVILSPDQIAQAEDFLMPGDTVVIPAFGVDVDLCRRLEGIPQITVIDTTCSDVKKIWDYVSSKAAEGYALVLHGKEGHPETEAILSRMAAGSSAVVVSSYEQARQLVDEVEFDLSRVAFAQQTTMPADQTKKIASFLEQAVAAKGGLFDACHSICSATQQRQDAARELCQQELDFVLVIGGFDSSNTRELYEIASKKHRTYFIQQASDITGRKISCFHPDLSRPAVEKQWLQRWNMTLEPMKIGILAGASTPRSTVGTVIDKLCSCLSGDGAEENM